MSTVTGPPLSLTAVDPKTVIARILSLLDQLPTEDAQIEAVSVGLAGAMDGDHADTIRLALTERFPRARVAIARDIDLLVCQLDGAGAAVVVGTGVVVSVPAPGGEVLVDGRGFAIGDRGGGAWIGLEAVRRSLRDIDREGRESSLFAALRAQLDLASDRGVAAALSAAGRLDQRRFAALAPTVLALADRGDRDAEAVIACAIDAVSESVGWALHRAAVPSAVELVIAGGVAGSAYFWPLLRASLNGLGRVQVVRRVDPLDGAFL